MYNHHSGKGTQIFGSFIMTQECDNKIIATNNSPVITCNCYSSGPCTTSLYLRKISCSKESIMPQFSMSVYSSMRMEWVVYFFLGCMWVEPSQAQANCSYFTDSLGECTIDTISQLSSLPDNVASLRLHFTISELVLGGGGTALPSLPMLRSLTMDMLNIASIQADACVNLPDLITLLLINTDMYRPHLEKTLGENAFRGLTSLTSLQARDTGVAHLTPNSFSGLSSLDTLDLSNNLLALLPDSIFGDTNLTSLDLSRNQLPTVNTTTLQGLTQLRTLDLSNNVISTLPVGAFTDLISLETLTISHNPLRALEPGTFQGLLLLNILDLADDQLTTIPSGVLTDMPSLESLDLYDNQIISIEDGAFSKLSSLKFLKLYDNPLQMLTNATFIGLTSLNYLNLRYIGLVRVEPGTFTPIPQLNVLHMEDSNLTYMAPGSLQGLQHLTVLTLHNNQLSSLEEGLLSGLDGINLLDLSGNPWHCDCQLVWLHAWIQARGQNFNLYHADTTTCATPDNTTGTQLTDFLAAEYPICVPLTSSPTTSPSTSPPKTSPPTSPPITSPSTSPPTTPSSEVHMAGILAGCILLAVLLVLLMAIILYCRQKKYAFWAPTMNVAPDAKTMRLISMRSRVEQDTQSMDSNHNQASPVPLLNNRQT